MFVQVNMSKDSVLSDLSRISSNKGADRGGLVPKSDRLRALEEELAALGVDEKLDNAYVDDQVQDPMRFERERVCLRCSWRKNG